MTYIISILEIRRRSILLLKTVWIADIREEPIYNHRSGNKIFVMKRCVGLFIFLLLGSLIHAQNQPPDNLQQQFNIYQSGNLQEKLYVHTDKTFYLAGETIWFKIYAVDASFHKPLSTSSIAYIEILNKDLKPVIQSKVLMSAGNGNGSVAIPGFLPSGNYVLRAYTNWMKNFSPEFYYEHTLHIVNTLKLSSAIPAAPLP